MGGSVQVRAIKKPRFAEHATFNATVRGGIVLPPQRVMMMAVTHRHGLAAACNPVMQMQGGMATVMDGVVIATSPWPLSGQILDSNYHPFTSA